MNTSLVDQQINFTEMHNQYIQDWNEAMRTGNISSLQRMTDEYYVAFFYSVTTNPTFFSKEEAIAGMQESVLQFKGANKKFTNRIIRHIDTKNVVVFFELIIEKEGEKIANLFTIENWQLISEKWMLVREIEQPIK